MNITPSKKNNFLPYAGRKAVLATMHSKHTAVAPALRAGVGLEIVTATGIDTDQLGTFSGEIPRNGTMLEVAISKTRLGMKASGLSLGLATEGTFGPHPALPFLAAGIELMTFVDDERKIVVSESFVAPHTNFDYLVVAPGEDLKGFLDRVGFPSHALIVRPNEGSPSQGLVKGILDASDLGRAIAVAASLSSDGKAQLETDMRAHLNPTRMQSLALLAEKLAKRLATACPECDAPGFGRTETREGLLCEACGAPTQMIATEVFSCASCSYREDRPRFDGLRKAPPGSCPECNP
ncbi:DUF6671 family protein [Bradyrhizobium sp. BR13661]|uniref:DUF6671 family protein n=1 Tax=Bradyrhizobium sp. BR13661 TaxID=2940622 RepID=UPI00247696C5|nr:DUF6671 family protein [Bradyrhizobium sp. BR13661]MDH6257547.1 ribosomal protein L37E [Bradyrhizobium sp. BR13661]